MLKAHSLSRFARWTAAMAVCAGLLFVVGCGDAARTAQKRGIRSPLSAPPAGVVLIVIDTLRADYVGAYGSDAGLTPTLDALAAGGVLFENATATSSWTRSSVASMFTSRYPTSISVLGRDDALPDGAVTLAEALRESGVRTLAVSTNKNAGSPYGFDRGFERFEVPDRKWRAGYPNDFEIYTAEGVTRTGLELLDTLPAGEPFFLFLHYVDPHDPYLPHPDLMAEAEPAGRFDGSRKALNELDALPPEQVTEADRARIAHLYAGEVEYCDLWIGRLLAGLEERGLADQLLVVVTSDHGEGLWDHGVRGHGRDLYEEMIRVPLLIDLPAGAGSGRLDGMRVEEPVSLVDLAPTVLGAFGVASPETFRGSDLLAFAAGADRSRRERLIYSEMNLDGRDFESLRQDSYKLLRDRRRVSETEALRLFDLAEDPAEREGRPPRGEGRALRRLLHRFGDELRQDAMTSELVNLSDLDASTLESLRALGYVGSAKGQWKVTPEIGAPLASRVDFTATEHAEEQLLQGFYEHERNRRWMAGRASVALARHGEESQWRIDGWIDLALHGRADLTLAVSVDGAPATEHRIDHSGLFLLAGPLPSDAGDQVRLDLTCDHDFIPEEEGRQRDERVLCAVIRSIGLYR